MSIAEQEELCVDAWVTLCQDTYKLFERGDVVLHVRVTAATNTQ
jgi:hypothetical protein